MAFLEQLEFYKREVCHYPNQSFILYQLGKSGSHAYSKSSPAYISEFLYRNSFILFRFEGQQVTLDFLAAMDFLCRPTFDFQFFYYLLLF